MALTEQQDEQLQQIDDQVQGKTDAPGTEDPGKPKKLATLSKSDIDDMIAGMPGGTSGIKQDVPANLPFQPKPFQDNALLRAQNQGALKQTALTIGNLVPNVVGDIIGMVGQIGNIPDYLTGQMPDENMLTKAADHIRDPFGEVFSEHPDKVFDWRDSASWLKAISGFAEGAASFALPGLAEAKGVEALADLIATGKTSLKAVMTAGKGISAFGMGYLMSADGAKKVADESYKANYDRFLREGFDSATADSKSKELAAHGAATALGIGTVLNGLLNLTALSPLYKTTPEEHIADMFRKGEGAIKEGETLEQWQNRLQEFKPDTDQYRHGLSSHSFQAAQVGLQGLNSEYAEKKGTEVGEDKQSPNLDVISDYLDKTMDAQGALNLFSGLLGGLTQNILLDHIPLNSVVKIDPSTNKPLMKEGEPVDDKGRYQTELVSARTRDIMGNRQYFSSMKDAVMSDITRMRDIKQKLANARTDFERTQYRNELMNVANLNAVSMGMTDSWHQVYDKIAATDNKTDLSTTMQPQINDLTEQIGAAQQQGTDTKPLEQQLVQLKDQQDKMVGTTAATQAGLARDMNDNAYKQSAIEAKANLSALQGIHDRISSRFFNVKDPDHLKLQDQMFSQEANHYLLGQAINKESGLIARDERILGPEHQYLSDQASYEGERKLIDRDIDVLKKAPKAGAIAEYKELAEVMSRYGINAYDKADLTDSANELVKRLQKRHDDNEEKMKGAIATLHDTSGFSKWKEANPDGEFMDYHKSLEGDYPIDPDITTREARLEQARAELAEKERGLAELNGTRGSKRFLKALQKNADMWKEQLDAENKKNMISLYKEQKSKEAAARLDKNQMSAMLNQSRQALVDNVAHANEIKGQMQVHSDRLTQLDSRKGFFNNLRDMTEKKDIRSKMASHRAELALLDMQRAGHENDIQNFEGAGQDAAIREQNVMQAVREDIVNPDDTPPPPDPTPTPATEPVAVPEQQSRSAEEAYAKLADTLAPSVRNTLDNLEYMGIFDNDEFHRDLVHMALLPHVDNQEISDERATELTETMREWWEEKKAQAPEDIPTTRITISAPEPVDLDNQVSQLPEPDSVPITFSGTFNASNADTSPILQEVGAKLTTNAAASIASASIKFMRTEKANGTVVYLPEYDKLDDRFNSNILKPNFIKLGDKVRFEVTTDYKGPGLIYGDDVRDEYGRQATREDSFADYSDNNGKIHMSSQLSGGDPAYANVPIRIIHVDTGETIGMLHTADWVTDKRTDAFNFKHVEDTIPLEDGTFASGNVAAQKARLMDIRAAIATAHNNGDAHLESDVTSRGPGHLFLNAPVNLDSEKSKLVMERASKNLPDPKLRLAILDRGTMMVAHGTPFKGDANFNEESLAKYKTGDQVWHNTPMVLLPMPNGAVTESPLFTKQLGTRPGDIHTVSRAIEIYRDHGTPRASAEHKALADKILEKTGYDVTDVKGLRNFINQYYTYTQKFGEQHTRSNASTGESFASTAQRPQFLLDIPDEIDGQKSRIKVGTTFSGQAPTYLTDKNGNVNLGFDEMLRSGLASHYKNVVYTNTDIKGINDRRPITAVTIVKGANGDHVRSQEFANYNEYTKSFTNTFVYGLHQKDGVYLYGANPVTEFDDNKILAAARATEPEEDTDAFSQYFTNNAPAIGPAPEPKIYTKESLTQDSSGKAHTVDQISSKIDELYKEAAENPEQLYHVNIDGGRKTRFRLKDGTYATHEKLGKLLADGKTIPFNVKLSDDMMSIIQNSAYKFRTALNSMIFEDDRMYLQPDVKPEILGEQLANTYVPVRDTDGKHTGGYFSIEHQKEVIGSIIYQLKVELDKNRDEDPEKRLQKTGDFMNRIKNNLFVALHSNFDRIAKGEKLKGASHITPEQAAQLRDKYQQVLNSFEEHPDTLSFWGEAKKRIDALGIRIKANSLELERGTDGRGADNFNDIFRPDPKDSASGRIKLQVATTVDSTIGDEIAPKDISLPFTEAQTREDILSGKKQLTIRTPEQAKAMGMDKLGSQGIATINEQRYRVTNLGPVAEGDAHAPTIGMQEGTQPKTGDYKFRLEKYTPKKDQLIPTKNFLGLPKLADYERLYQDAMVALGDTPRNFDGYMAKLRDEGANGNPNLIALANGMKEASKQLQNEFVSVMTMSYQPFTMVLADTLKDPSGKPFYRLRVIDANRGSQLETIKSHWQQAQKFSLSLVKGKDGTIVNKKLAAELKTELDQVNKLFDSGNAQAPNAARALLVHTLESNGIVMPEKAIDSLIANTARWTNKTSIAGDFRQQFAISDKNEPRGIVSTMIMRMLGEGTPDDNGDTPEANYQIDNPLYGENTTMKVLAGATAAYAPTLYSQSHRNFKGDNIYDWGMPSNLTNTFSKLKNDTTWRESFQDNDFAKRSWMLEVLHNNEEKRNRAGLTFLDAIKSAYGDGTQRTEMSDREQLLTSIGLFINGNSKAYAHYLSLTHSDKSTSPIFMNMPRLATVTLARDRVDQFGVHTLNPELHKDVMTRMHDVFMSEYDRITKASQNEYNDKRYNEGAKHFLVLPQFEQDNMKRMVKDGEITEKDLNTIWPQGNLGSPDDGNFRPTVEKMLRKHVADLTASTLKEWTDKGVLESGVPFDRRYVTRLLAAVGISGRTEDVMGTPKTVYRAVRTRDELPAEGVEQTIATLAARDYAVNHFLFNVSQSQIFYGDPAQAWKGSTDKTYVEYGKRLAQFISPKKEGNWYRPAYTSIVAKDFITHADYVSLKDAYRDINATDAQELTTVQEKLDTLKAYGRLDGKTYDEMSKIVSSAKGGFYEFTDPKHLETIFQPEKPQYSGNRAPVNGAALNDYVKSSAYALYPPLLIGRELDKLRTAMETDKAGVQRLAFESAKKMGIPSEPVALFDAQGRINPEVFKSKAWLEGARQQLSRDNYGLSQEIPYDDKKMSIGTVSQMNKLISSQIPTIKTPFDFEGQKMTGEELALQKEDIRKQLVGINQKRLVDEVGGEMKDGELVVRDKKKLYGRLVQHAKEQGGYSPNDLAILQHTLDNSDELIVPLMYSPSASKFESLVMSLVNDVVGVDMPGKSYVQASSAGYRSVRALGELSEAEKKSLIRVGNWNGEPLKATRVENGEVHRGQVIMPWPLTGSPQDYMKEDGTIDLERVPPEALQIIAARIPNSGHNLMHAMEPVAFVPAQMGDLMLIPDALVRQMGSDFDVDKLYTYRRGYKQVEGKYVPDEDPEAALKTSYFNMHWSVLTHPEMVNRIMQPLDMEDLKQIAEQIEKWENKGKAQLSFYDPMYQLKDFQSQRDAKQLVGRSSLNVTFDSVIQDKDMPVGYYGLSEGGGEVPVETPVRIIDEDGKLRELTHISGYGQSTYKQDGQRDLIRTKHDNHVMQQVEFLDYSKNRISDKVHITTHSYAASGALSQLQEKDEGTPGTDDFKPGWAPSIKYNSMLLSQPIVQEFSQEMAKAQDTFSGGQSYDPNLKDTTIDKLIDKYMEKGNLKSLPDATPVKYEDLEDSVRKGDKQAAFYTKQIQAIRIFRDLTSIGDQMSVAQSTINHDTKGADANLLTAINQDKNKDNLINGNGLSADKPGILNAQDLYTRKGGKLTEQGYLYNVAHGTAFGIAGDLFPYKDMMPLFGTVMEQTGRTSLSVDQRKSMFNAMKSYLFSHPKLGLWDNPQLARTRLFYGDGKQDSLAVRLQQAKDSWGRNDLFLQRLSTDIDPDKLRPDYINYQASKVSNVDLDENSRYWVDLLTSDNKEKQDLGYDLVRYAYLSGGIQDAQNFVKFLPYSFLLGTDFGHRLRELTTNLEQLASGKDFQQQVFQHNPQLAKRLSSDLKETGSTYEKYPERFTLPPYDPEKNNSASSLVVSLKDGGRTVRDYPDYLSHYSNEDNKWILYKKGHGSDFVRIDTLGSSYMDEYSADASRRSLIPDNRSYAYDNIEPAFRMLNGAVNANHGKDVLQDIGMPRAGGQKEMSEVLARISADPSVPDHSRVLASWLGSLPGQHNTGIEVLSHIMNKEPLQLPEFNFKVVRQADMEHGWSAANMDTLEKRLTVNQDAIRNKGDLAMYLNHELMHYHTAGIAQISERPEFLDEKYGTDTPIRSYIDRVREDIFESHPEVKEAIRDLENIRRQAADALSVTMGGKAAYDHVLQEVKAGKFTTGWHSLVYGMDNNAEFIAHCMTDYNFMRFLNARNVEGKPGILNQLADIVKRITMAIAKTLGVDIRRGSLLEGAIDKTMKLMMLDPSFARPTYEEMASPQNMEGMFSNNALASPVLTAMDRLVGKLQEQKQMIEDGLTGRDLPKEYTDKIHKLNELEKDIENLQQHQSLEIAAQVGKKHMEWVDRVLEAKDPTTSQIMTATRVLQVWGNLLDLVYGEGGTEEHNMELLKVAEDAKKKSNAMLGLQQRALIDLSSGVIQVKDFSPANLKDISKDQSLLRDVVSSATNRTVQWIGSHMQTVAHHRDEDMTRLLKETRSMEDALADHYGRKNLQEVYKKLMQENKKGDAWGLVQPFSQNWYDFRRDLRDRRKLSLRNIDRQVEDPIKKSQLKREAWSRYWKDINDNAIFADTRKLFDRDSSELKNDDTAKAHIKELEDATNPETAKDLIDEAQDRYRQYLSHEQAHFDDLETQVAEGKMTEDEANHAKTDWKERFSPNAFFQSKDSKLGAYGSDYYAKMAPRSKMKGFYDDKYHEIQKDPHLKKFYDWTVKKMEDFKDMLPVTVNDEHLGANFFPVVKKSLMTNMLDIPAYLKTMNERTIRDLSATEFEEQANDKSYQKIPINYVDRDQKANPIESRSTDIPRVMEMFGMMSLHYKHFSNAKDTIDMGESILQQIDQARAAGNTQMSIGGKLMTVKDGLKNTLQSLRYMKDYILYKKARTLEGRSDAKLYSLNPAKQIKITHEVKELLAERHDVEEKYMNGEMDPEEGTRRLAELNKKIDAYGGTRIYGSKLGDKLITINQLKTLSYNPTSGLANMTFGVISAMIHANGGRDFNKTEFFQALNIMRSSTAKWLSIGTHESEQANKILAIMDRTGVIGDVVDSRYGKMTIRDRKPGWQHAINPWNWMKSGDYFMKGLTTVAMLLHDKVDVTENGENKKVSMWEALGHDGQWDSKRFGEDKGWHSENVDEQTKWDAYRNKVVRVNMIIHGNQDKTSPKLANKYILGRLLGQFRMSWLPEGWYSRFQPEKEDLQLGRTVEGRYRTWGHLGIGGSILTHLRQAYSIIGKIDPFTGTTRLDGKPLSETDRENMRRNFAELGFIAGAVGMTVYIRALAADTDDEVTAARYRYLMNTIIRNKQDLEFYASPQVFDAVTRDVIPAAQVLKDYGKAMMATGKLLFNDDYEFQKWLLAMTHAGLPIPQATQINKMKYMMTKDIDNSQY